LVEKFPEGNLAISGVSGRARRRRRASIEVGVPLPAKPESRVASGRSAGCDECGEAGGLRTDTMKVKDLMTTDVRTCTPDTTAAAAAHLMWEADCGILPVVDNGRLLGVVTDRDMYIALATRNMRAADLTVGAVATNTVATCAPEDDVRTALATMREHRVRRLPVIGLANTVLGILSMNDILLAAGVEKGVRHEAVVCALKAICGHHHPAPQVVAA